MSGLLQLPPGLAALYAKSEHRPAADTAQQSFLPWLDHFGTNLPFFPEYTDHGRAHPQSVLHSAEALISESSGPLLTPDDAVLLVLATLLHDAAMALTPDQFLALVCPLGVHASACPPSTSPVTRASPPASPSPITPTSPALIRGGMDAGMARATAQRGIQHLIENGVATPTRIPWSK